MSLSHFVIWTVVAVTATSVGIVGWYARQLWIGLSAINARVESAILDQDRIQKGMESLRETVLDVAARLKTLEAWAASWVAFQESVSKQQSARVDDLNKRLVDIETENKITAPVKRDDDDDPFGGPRSWSAQAAAAERGAMIA